MAVDESGLGNAGPDRSRGAGGTPGGLGEWAICEHRHRPYRAGRSPNWVKVKNRTHPASVRRLPPGKQRRTRRSQRDRQITD